MTAAFADAVNDSNATAIILFRLFIHQYSVGGWNVKTCPFL